MLIGELERGLENGKSLVTNLVFTYKVFAQDVVVFDGLLELEDVYCRCGSHSKII